MTTITNNCYRVNVYSEGLSLRILKEIPRLYREWLIQYPLLNTNPPPQPIVIDETPETFRKIVAFVTDRENYPFPHALYKRLEYWEIPYKFKEFTFSAFERIMFPITGCFIQAYPGKTPFHAHNDLQVLVEPTNGDLIPHVTYDIHAKMVICYVKPSCTLPIHVLMDSSHMGIILDALYEALKHAPQGYTNPVKCSNCGSWTEGNL